jgi:hypothetical protein
VKFLETGYERFQGTAQGQENQSTRLDKKGAALKVNPINLLPKVIFFHEK